MLNKKSFFLALCVAALSLSTFSQAATSTKDWPQACYNEVSMWVTEACKEYIETVYYPELTSTTTSDTTSTSTSTTTTSDSTFLAGPGSVFGAGILGFVVILAVYLYLKRSGLLHRIRHDFQ